MRDCCRNNGIKKIEYEYMRHGDDEIDGRLDAS